MVGCSPIVLLVQIFNVLKGEMSFDDAVEKLQHDLYYVKNNSLFLDHHGPDRHRGGRVVGKGCQITMSRPGEAAHAARGSDDAV
jgi:hypothetical protein